MAIIYWIRRPEHTDIFKEGYVGVTARDLEDRIADHVRASNGNGKSAYAVHRAIKSIGIDNLVYSTVLIAEEDYCYDVEHKLRPQKRIGWNIAEDGSKPPSRKGVKLPQEEKDRISKIWKGKKRSPESVQKSVQSRKGFKHSEESIEKMRQASTGVKQSQETIDKRLAKVTGQTRTEEQRKTMSEARLSKNPWEVSTTNIDLWSNADSYYEMWIDEKSPYKVSRKLKLTHKALEAMFRRFESGYIPLENEVWLETFRKDEPEEFENA